MNERDIDAAIAKAQSSRSALDELEKLRARVAAVDAPAASLGRIWDALVRAARGTGDIDRHIAALEGRAEWAASAKGELHPDTVRAWAQMGAVADQEMKWGAAERAWEHVVAAAVPENAGPQLLIDVGAGLRGLTTTRLKQGRLPEARALAERELAVREKLDPNPPGLALSLDNLAYVLEQLGDRERATAIRERQASVLEAAFGPDDVRTRTAREKAAALRAATA